MLIFILWKKVPAASTKDIQQEVEAHHPTWNIQSLRLRKYIRRARREMDIMQDLSTSSLNGGAAGDDDTNHVFGIKGVIKQAGIILAPFSKRRRPSKSNFVPETIQSFDERESDRDSPVTVDSTLDPSTSLTTTQEEGNAASTSKSDKTEPVCEETKIAQKKDLYVDDNDGNKEREICQFCEGCNIL